MKYTIYQLKEHGNDVGKLRFMNHRYAVENGGVRPENYEAVYNGTVTEEGPICALEDLYERFNRNRPDDFIGHSPSVSDVFLLDWGDRQQAYYCDSIGWKRIPFEV